MPPAAYTNTTLQELVLKRVIRIDAVQRWRDAAIKESRQPDAPVSTEGVELFFDCGHFPGPYRRWLISTAEPGEPPPKLTALEQALLAARRAWAQLVRDLRNGKIVVTGKSTALNANRQEISPGKWGDANLGYDVPDNTVYIAMKDDDGRRNRIVPRWVELQVCRAPTAGKREGRPPEIRRRLGANADYNWPEIKRIDAEEYWEFFASHGKPPTWEDRASLISDRISHAPNGDYLRTSGRVAKSPAKPKP